MEQYQTVNCLLNSGSLGTGTGSPLAKTNAAALAKADGNVFTISAANMPALTTAVAKDGSTPGDLADGSLRVYTFLSTYDPEDGTYSNSVVVGADFSGRGMKMSDINYGNVSIADSFATELKNSVVLGFVLIEANGADFVPGTTDLDDANVIATFIDAYGFVGQ